MNKELYNNVHGLSCVENQVLAILMMSGYNISLFYADSGIWLKELFLYFMLSNGDYEYFNRVPRIQDELKQLGIISLELISSEDISLIKQELEYQYPNRFILIRTNSLFASEELGIRGWRDDHFVFIEKSENGYVLYNDIPILKKMITGDKLESVYGGQYFSLRILRKLNTEDKLLLWKNRLFKPELYENFQFLREEIVSIPDYLNRLQNLACVFKITRYRMYEYYQNYLKVPFSFDYLQDIEHIHTLVKYYGLRKTVPLNTVFEQLGNMVTINNKIMLELKQNLEEIVHGKF